MISCFSGKLLKMLAKIFRKNRCVCDGFGVTSAIKQGRLAGSGFSSVWAGAVEGSHRSARMTYSLLIPCFRAWVSRKRAIHAVFHEAQKKFPVIFPVLGKF
jgi:hypothetical protein